MEAGSRINQDVVAGGVFLLFGLFLLVFGRDYPLGTALRVGPGFVPLVVGSLLALVGGALVLRGWYRGAPPVERAVLRPLVLICLAVLGFSLLIEDLGLILTGCVVMLFAATAGQEFRLREQVLLALGVSLGSTFLFVYFLGLPMRYWPDF